MKYIAFYDTEEYKLENRSVQPSAANVVIYIAEKLSEISKVTIISPSRTLNTTGKYKGRKTNVNDKIELIQPPSVGVKGRIGRVLVLLFTQIWLIIYLLLNTRKNETLVAYYSLFTISPLKILNKIKKLNLILEVREIYSDVSNNKSNKREKELNFLRSADAYIVPTIQLNNIINTEQKRFILNCGVFKMAKKHETNHFCNTKIHVVYAGTLSREKGGAYYAADIAKYLPEMYHIHILGFGTKDEVTRFIEYLDNIKKSSQAEVSYDGLLRGEQFNTFLQNCDIGLATQDLSGDFNNTSFPSKILTYLANGLTVLSSPIDAVKNSQIGSKVYYYEKQDPENIAEHLMNIVLNCKGDIEKLFSEADNHFRNDLKQLVLQLEEKR